MPERTCISPHEYAGRQVKVGERFEVEPAHVELMIGLGRIKREEGDEAPAHVARDVAATWPNIYNTREMSAKKRNYSRKAA